MINRMEFVPYWENPMKCVRINEFIQPIYVYDDKNQKWIRLVIIGMLFKI